MYSQKISRGLVMGYGCPVSGKEFVKTDPSPTELEAFYIEQQAHTRAVIFELGEGRPLEAYQNEWKNK